jgi:hypothetical protein
MHWERKSLPIEWGWAGRGTKTSIRLADQATNQGFFPLLESLKGLFGALSFSCYYLHGLLAPLCATETIAQNIASLYHREQASLIHNPL